MGGKHGPGTRTSFVDNEVSMASEVISSASGAAKVRIASATSHSFPEGP